MPRKNNLRLKFARVIRKGAVIQRPFRVLGGGLACFVLWAGAVNAALPCAADRVDERALVSKVFDGDTVELADGRHVRFVGINTPEVAHEDTPAQPLAEEARAALESLLQKDHSVLLRYDAERFDVHRRTLAHVYLSDHSSIEANLLGQGLAFTIAIPPNMHDSACYLRQEKQARAAKRGVWGESYYTPLDAQRVDANTLGFQLLRGQVQRIGQGKNTLWLNLAPRMALRIAREDLANFTAYNPEKLRGKSLLVRGWITQYKNGDLVMRVRHPAAIELQ